MAKGFEIGVGVDTKAAKQALDAGLVAPLEDAQDELKKLGDSRGPEELERSLRDAQNETQRLERDTRATAESISENYKRAYREQRQSAEQASSSSKEAMSELKNEALANASETFSSFDGSVTSFVDGVQGTFGGLIAGLGSINPALVPIAAGAAVTIGVISGAITNAETQTEAFKAKVTELTAEFIESGTIGGRSFEAMVSSIKDLATETDDSLTNLEDLRDYAKDLGVSFEDVVNAYTQGGDALDDLIAKTAALREQQRQDRQPFEQPTQGALEYGKRLYDINAAFTSQQEAIRQATELQSLYYSSGVTELEAKAGLIEAINTAYDEAAGATQNFINTETGVFDVAAYIDSMQKREEALRNYQETLATSGLSDQAMAFLNEQGAEAAAAMLQGYQSAAPAQKAELDRIWSEAARQNSGTYLRDAQLGLSAGALKGPQIALETPSVAGVLAGLQTGLNQRTLKVNVDLQTRDGKKIV